MKLIDKDALVAEIERRNEESWLGHYTKEKGIAFDITEDILSFINTMEVIEVDLEKELQRFNKEIIDDNGFFNPLDIAKHFFELGLKAQFVGAQEECEAYIKTKEG